MSATGGAPAAYAAPVLTGLTPPLVDTDYAGVLGVAGREFGSAAEAGAVDSLTLVASTGEVFTSRACAVNVSFTLVTCLPPLGGLRGRALTPRLSIAGQATTSVALPTAAPRITGVAFAAAAGDDGCGGGLCTRGRQPLLVTGVNFGPLTHGDGSIVLHCASGGGGGGGGPSVQFVATGCEVTVADTAIACTSAPGFGGRLAWTVRVLGVASEPFVSPLGYAPPSIAGLSGPAPAVGSRRALAGRNFATAYAPVVTVSLDGGPPAAPLAVGVNGSLDTLAFAMPPGVGRGHTLVVSVGGQASAPLSLAYDPPVLVSAGLFALARGAYHVYLSGANFGGASGAIDVAVGSEPCAVSAVADAAIMCWTAAAAGAVALTVGGQTAAAAVIFNASDPVPVPLFSSDNAGTAAPLTGGVAITLSGSAVVPRPPSTGVLLAVDGAGVGSAVACAMARALRASGLSSNWCTSVVFGAGELTCVTPAWPRARAHLVLAVLGLKSCSASAPRVVVFGPPRVTSVDPPLLPTAGGALLALRGSGLEEGIAVYM